LLAPQRLFFARDRMEMAIVPLVWRLRRHTRGTNQFRLMLQRSRNIKRKTQLLPPCGSA
jgi:hypothetical protein